MSIAKQAAQHLAAAQDFVSLAEILAMLNYDATQFNAMCNELEQRYDLFLSWHNQPEGTEVWDGVPVFENGSFTYHGWTAPSGSGDPIAVPLPHDAVFSL